MSRLFPHPLYAEDQPYAHTILITHVLTRGIQTGSLIGLAFGTSIHTLRRYNILSPRPISTFTSTILRSSGVGAVLGLGVLAIAIPLRMRGREDIEWQDRSWRLLENKGQLECDDWTYPGMGLGLVAVATKGSEMRLGWRGIAAGAGLGSVAAMVGYMGWRYGFKRGKFDNDILE